MGLDAYGNYSRSVRQGSVVRRVYFGKGPVALLAANLDHQRRADRQARAKVWAEREAARVPAEASLNALDELAERMMRATLLAAGYHQHNRGAWRRRMNGNGAMDGKCMDNGILDVQGAYQAPSEGPTREASPPPIAPGDPGDRPLTKGEFLELIRRAEQGDRTVLPTLRRLLDLRPGLWQLCGDVARTAEADWVTLLAGPNLLVRESLTRKIVELKGDLAGPETPPLERLLADRVASCWMQANHADSAFAQLKGQKASIAQLDLMQRRQERTQRSYLAAIKALATVRKLTVTASPVGTTEAVGVEKERPKENRPVRGRERVAESASGYATKREGSGGCHKQARDAKLDKMESVVPRSLRDRMRGLVESEN